MENLARKFFLHLFQVGTTNPGSFTSYLYAAHARLLLSTGAVPGKKLVEIKGQKIYDQLLQGNNFHANLSGITKNFYCIVLVLEAVIKTCGCKPHFCEDKVCDSLHECTYGSDF